MSRMHGRHTGTNNPKGVGGSGDDALGKCKICGSKMASHALPQHYGDRHYTPPETHADTEDQSDDLDDVR